MLQRIEGLTAAALISVTAALIHYEALRLISSATERAPGPHRLKLLALILGVLVAHGLEAGIYGIGFWLGAGVLHFGRFIGAPPSDAFQYYFFALETYTTQSVGDTYPVGGLRFMASLEPLVGLILIGWSTSLTFVAMRRFWDLGGEPSTLTDL